MNRHDHQALSEQLKQFIAPQQDTELHRDLWPRMLQRLDQSPSIRVPWFDWVLAAAAGAALIVFPGAIPVLLYHL